MVNTIELRAIQKKVRSVEQKKSVKQSFADHTGEMDNFYRPRPSKYGSYIPDIEFLFTNGKIRIVEIENGKKDKCQIKGLQNSSNASKNVKFNWFWATEIV